MAQLWQQAALRDCGLGLAQVANLVVPWSGSCSGCSPRRSVVGLGGYCRADTAERDGRKSPALKAAGLRLAYCSSSYILLVEVLWRLESSSSG